MMDDLSYYDDDLSLSISAKLRWSKKLRKPWMLRPKPGRENVRVPSR